MTAKFKPVKINRIGETISYNRGDAGFWFSSEIGSKSQTRKDNNKRRVKAFIDKQKLKKSNENGNTKAG